MDLLRSYNREGLWSFSVSFCAYSYLSFCASGIKPGCPSVLALLCLPVRNKRKLIHILLFFHKDEQPHTFPMICRNSCATAMFNAGNQQLLTVRMAKTRTSTVDRDTKQLFRTTGPRIMHRMCSYTCTKRLSTLTFIFQEM